MMQQLVLFGNNSIDEERAIEKILRVVPDKYLPIAITIETMMEFEASTIEDVTGRLKAIDHRAPSKPATSAPQLLYTEEQWLASESGRRMLLRLRRAATRKRRPRKKDKAPQGRGGAPRGADSERKAYRGDMPRFVEERGATVKHTSRRRRRVRMRLCSSTTGALSCTPFPPRPAP